MCWFAGFSYKDETLLKRLWNTLKDRAIDEEYFYYEENISFYHAHLKISDLDKDTSQPLFHWNYIIWLVWEIYNKDYLLWLVWINNNADNYTELQVIWFCYEKLWGNFINYVNWEFAIFIYDKNINTYFLFRDRWGVNNVYYKVKNGNLYFASEIKSLIIDNPKLNKSSFIEHMIFQFWISPNTIVEWIFTLRPWTYLKFKDWKYKIYNFEKYIYQEDSKYIIDTIEKSVIRRIPKFQDKIFISLSWWPDSNLILFFLKKHYKWQIIAYSFFTDENIEEIEIAKNNTKLYWIEHNLIDMNEFNFNNLEEDIYVHEWLVNLPNLWKILKEKITKYKNVKVEFWWDWKEELILWNNHYPYKEIMFRYKYFNDKNLIKDFNITQEFLNKEMFDYNLQMIDKITLRNWIERRLPFTDYEMLKYYKYKTYRTDATNFLNSNWLNIVNWEYWFNLWLKFRNLYDEDLIIKKEIFFKILLSNFYKNGKD